MWIRTKIIALDEFVHNIFNNELSQIKKLTVNNELYSLNKCN